MIYRKTNAKLTKNAGTDFQTYRFLVVVKCRIRHASLHVVFPSHHLMFRRDDICSLEERMSSTCTALAQGEKLLASLAKTDDVTNLSHPPLFFPGCRYKCIVAGQCCRSVLHTCEWPHSRSHYGSVRVSLQVQSRGQKA